MPINEYSKTGSSNSTVGAVNFVENQAANALNDSAREFMADMKKWYDDQSGSLTTTGASNVYSLTTNSIVAGTTLATGIRVSFKANFANTGAATHNVNGKGAKAIRKFGKSGEVDISANDTVLNGRYDVEYESIANSAAGVWILLNPSMKTIQSQSSAGLLRSRSQ